MLPKSDEVNKTGESKNYVYYLSEKQVGNRL